MLAPASTTGTGRSTGSSARPIEQLAYHIHAHLAVFENGRLDALPGGIGIPGSQDRPDPARVRWRPAASAIYWLHTHAPDGVIHIESPTKRIYTLGQFFDEWHQPLTSNRSATLQGKITAFVNGKPWTKSVRAIPLVPHAVIQFNVGEPAPPLTQVDWAGPVSRARRARAASRVPRPLGSGGRGRRARRAAATLERRSRRTTITTTPDDARSQPEVVDELDHAGPMK